MGITEHGPKKNIGRLFPTLRIGFPVTMSERELLVTAQCIFGIRRLLLSQ